MSIECYLDNCPHHSDFELDDRPSQGPFCSLMDCAWDLETISKYLEAVRKPAKGTQTGRVSSKISNVTALPRTKPKEIHYTYTINGMFEGTVRVMSGSVFAINMTSAFIEVIGFWTADPAILITPTYLSIKATEDEPCKPLQELNT